MPTASLLSDDLVRALMAAGEVDVLVGVPTLNHAATIQPVLRAISDAFARYFPRERTLLLNCDGGSTDETLALVHGLKDDGAVTVHHRLRTEHRITAPYHGLPGKGGALRQILTVADLTQAKAVAVLDADVTTLTPDWIAALIRPIRTQHFDYVAPIYSRHPIDGPLITQLVRPLVRSAYGFRVREPLAAEFGCSSRFLSHCLEQDVWDSDWAQYGIDLWITSTALAGGFACCEAPLGPRQAAISPDRPVFPEIFRQVVSATFGCLEQQSAFWLSRSGSEPLPIVGAPYGGVADPPVQDGARLAASFCEDIRNLQEVLEPIVGAETLAALNSVAREGDRLHFPDALWVETVHHFLLAHRRGLMRREHIGRALVPLYLGRVGSFLMEYGGAPADDVDAALEALCLEFERSKPMLADRWAEASQR